MPRVHRGFKARRRRNKVLQLAKGFRGGKGRLYRTAVETVDRALVFAYRDRRNKKRDMRSLWIARISAGVEMNGASYSRFMDGLHKAGIELDRKVLSNLAIVDPAGFGELVKTAVAARA